MRELYLGVDGGQSTTTALIGDADGNVVGFGTAGPCNHVGAEEGRQRFLTAIRESVSHATDKAELAQTDGKWRFKAACLGMSGGPDDKSALLSELIDARSLIVTHDAAIALAGALAGAPGIVVIGGTGSMAFGQNARGEAARAGGWGYIFGDEGGAFDIARQALRAVLREHEGWGGRTALTPALLETTRTADPHEMLHLLYTQEWPRASIAELAQTVDRIAQEGDPTAVGLMTKAAQDLALLAGSVRRQLWNEGEPARVSWIGGVFQSTTLLDRFRLLISLEGDVTAETAAHGPAFGALLLARRAAGPPPAV